MRGVVVRQLAMRYLRGKRGVNAVPVLSRISMVAIAVGSCAMIILFSVFNGFEALVKQNYKAFYPDLKITPARGKFFKLTPQQTANIQSMTGVSAVTTVIEDNVLAREDNMGGSNKGIDNQLVVTLKGIDHNYMRVNDLHPYLLQPADSVSEGQPNTALAGEQILKQLGVDPSNVYSYLMLYYLNPAVTNPEADPESAFESLRLHPSGGFSVLEEFDSRYILAPLSLARKLFNADSMCSSLELSVAGGKLNDTKSKLAQLLGKNYRIESRYEQNKTMYMVMNTEKWAVYIILLLVLFIASFNMVGALFMLVLEKQKDLSILKAMGLGKGAIRAVILAEGVLWALIGGGVGLILGTIICLAQQYFGIIKINGSFLVDAYPVKIELTDILLVLATIIVVGLSASFYPAIKSSQALDPTLKSA